MSEAFKYLSDYLTGRSLYSPIIRLLNFYLTVCITSYIFKRFYFTYSLLDLTDYKGIYAYFVRGDFAVALILFTTVHYGISIIGESVFHLLTYLKSSQWTASIIKRKIRKKDYTAFFKSFNQFPIETPLAKFDKGVLLKYFELLKNAIPKEDWEKAQKIAEKKKEEIKNNFKLVFKGLIGLSVFFSSVPYFGWRLYIFSMILSIAGLIFLLFSFVILDVSPLLFRKINAELTRILQEHQASSSPDQQQDPAAKSPEVAS